MAVGGGEQRGGGDRCGKRKPVDAAREDGPEGRGEVRVNRRREISSGVQ